MLTSLTSDLRFGIRVLLRQPARSLLLVLTLALGIGANAALFTVVNAVILRPLPYPEPDRLVRIWDRNERAGLLFFSASVPHFFAWRDRTRSFAAVGAYREDSFTLSRADGPAPVEGVRMTATLFDVLQVSPALGRTFAANEDRPGDPLVAVVSHEFWRRELNGHSAAIGQRILLGGQAHTVVGVMPATFAFPQRDVVDIMVPYGLALDPASDGAHFLRVLGRMRPGVTLQAANDDLVRVARQYDAETPAAERGWLISMRSLHDAVVGPVGDTLIRLQGACLLVLLIATVNVATLLLVRAAGRASEMAVRAALGAGVMRLARQLLTESLLIAAIGSIAGLALASLLLGVAPRWLPDSIPRVADLSIDRTVVAFVLIASTITGLLFGVVPAVGPALRTRLLSGGATRSATSAHGFLLRRVLVGLQLGLALTLLAGAALLVQSSLRLANIDRGFQSSGVLTFDTRLAGNANPSREQRAQRYRQIVGELATVPGVTSVGVTHRLPLTGNSSMPFRIAGRPTDAPASQVNFRSVSGDYFTALDIARVRGRGFTDQDTWERGNVAMINQSAARQFWPNEDPIGQRLVLNPKGPPTEVIGIVADTDDGSLRGGAAPALYLPYVQAPGLAMTFVVRTAVDPASIASAAARAVARVDGQLPIAHVQTLDAFMDDALAQPRFNSFLASLFAGLALILAAVGVYGVIASLVAARTKEFGIRLALGARPAQVIRQLVTEGARMALGGIVLGVGAALVLGRFLADLLYNVSPTDPATLAGTSVALLLIALAAAIVPARRVLHVDPVTTLRND
jgi:putative ABC transport system permease protein